MAYKYANCRACRKLIIFGLSPAGKVTPFDADALTSGTDPRWANPPSSRKPTLYTLDAGDPPQATKVTVPTLQPCYISHFATCPSASEFSRGR